MGLLSMEVQEHMLHTRYIAEASKLHGHRCLLYTPKTTTHNLHHDDDSTYNNPIAASILFESDPKPVLKNYNWFSEEESMPYIAYITNLDENYQDIVIERNTIVELEHVQVHSNLIKKFIITEIRGSKINPLYWICKLVPYREKIDG